MVSEDLMQIHEGPGMGRTLLLVFLCHTGCALEMAVPPSQVGVVWTDAVLPCTFKVDNYPINLQFLAIFWHFKENEIARYDSKTRQSTSRFTIDEQAAQQGNASLTIHNVNVADKGIYKCTVVYSPDTKVEQIQFNTLAVPVVRIQKKYFQRHVTNILQCSITNFFPNDMKVIWLKNGRILSGSIMQDDKMNADKTFTRNSRVNVTFLEEEGNPKITCQVEHEYLQDPIKDSYIVQFGAAPTVSIKASKTPDANDQIYMCEATNYSPEEVTMHWLLDGKRINSPRKSNNGYFNKEICYRIQLDGNNLPSQISCEVQHETLNSPLRVTQEVKVERECKRSCHFGLIGVLLGLLVAVPTALWYFMKRDSQLSQVGHIHRKQTAGDRVTLFCMASNWPKAVQVSWKILGEGGEEILNSDTTRVRDEEMALVDGSDYNVETDRSHSHTLHHAISTLSFTPVMSRHKAIEVLCTFHCGRRTEKRSLKCSFTLKKPEVSGPVQLSLGDNGDVLCSVALHNFYPKDIVIKWSHGLGHFQDVETISETFTKNNDFTFNVRSECRVPGHLFKDDGYRVRVTWSHEATSDKQEVSIADSKWRPVMGEIEKSAIKDGEEAKLLFRISGYFPDVLDVKWLRRETESQEWCVLFANEKYKIPVIEATQQEDKTFTYTACLNLSVSAATDCGAEFICRVRHPSLKTPLERSSGELRVIGIRAVTVTRPSNDKIRAEVYDYTPEGISVTWKRKTNVLKNYEECTAAAAIIKSNRDGTYTAYSEITLKENSTKYKVFVKHDASHSAVEKTVELENGNWYLVDNEDRKTLLHQIPDLQHGKNVNAENKEPPEDTLMGEGMPAKKGKRAKSGKR